MNKYGTLLKSLREENKLSTSYISGLLNISEMDYIDVEKGTKNLSKNDLNLLSNIYLLSVDALMQGKKQIIKTREEVKELLRRSERNIEQLEEVQNILLAKLRKMVDGRYYIREVQEKEKQTTYMIFDVDEEIFVSDEKGKPIVFNTKEEAKQYIDEMKTKTIKKDEEKEKVPESGTKNANELINAFRNAIDESGKAIYESRNENELGNAIRNSINKENKVLNELRANKEVMIEEVRKNGYALDEASEELQNDKDVVIEAVRETGNALQFASDELQNDKDVVIEAVKKDGNALQFASEELQNDKEVVIEAVKTDGNALQFASEKLQNDKDVVIVATEQNKNAIQYASDELQEDEEFMHSIVSKNSEHDINVDKDYFDKDYEDYEEEKNLTL